jgi:integrase
MANLNQYPMYRTDLKERFIAFKGKSYIGKLKALFRKSYTLEAELNKDLYQFNQKELEELFTLLNFTNVTDTYNSIKYYLDYCKDQGLIENNLIVPFSPHYFEAFTENKSLRFKEEQLNSFISQCINEQDQLILKLLFEGVYGEECSELLNLKRSDISEETNILQLHDKIKGSSRELKVSNECMVLIKKSLNTDASYYSNGEVNSGIPYEYYCDNDYVIRTSKKQAKDETKPASRSLMTSRFKLFQKWFQSPITPYSVFKSGMLNYAIDISKKQGIHINDFRHEKQWSKIAKKYPMQSRVNNGVKQFYSLFDELKKANELYGDYLDSNFEPLDETKVDKDIVERKKRNTAPKFKKMILEAYEGTCAVTGETTEAVLEACHIQNFINEESDNYQNGLLLRVDIHRLFDKGLIQLNEDYTLSVSSRVVSDYYQLYNGTKLILPKNKNWLPSKKVLRYRNENYFIKK